MFKAALLIAVDYMTAIRKAKIIPDFTRRELPAARAEIARVVGVHTDNSPTDALGLVTRKVIKRPHEA